MIAPHAAMKTPPEELHLWWLAQPGQPRHVGTLNMARVLKGVSLRYAPQWLQSGFALSEDLPLLDQEFLPHDKETAAGAVDDARPDRWGERVIRVLERPPRLSVLDFLFYAGDERFGALGVSLSCHPIPAARAWPLAAFGRCPGHCHSGRSRFWLANRYPKHSAA
jgi:serine/threonine-protein kinase HipA